MHPVGDYVSERSRLVVDIDDVRRNYDRLSRALDGCQVYFALKCLPEVPVLRALAACGCGFEVASGGEVELLRDSGLLDRDVVFSAPIKLPADIRRAVALGIRRFVADCTDEIDKLAECAPGSEVLLRLGVDSEGSVMPLSEKFGTTREHAVELAVRASSAGLAPVGLTFHVGSQAEKLDVWTKAIDLAGATMCDLDERGVRVTTIDIGGGFPVPYDVDVPDVESIGRTVADALRALPYRVEVSAEPGRYLVASAGQLRTRVVGVAHRAGERWVYVNAGVYHGLAEASAGVAGLRFPVHAPGAASGASVPSVVAGHSCDGTDVIARDVLLPAALRTGDELVFTNAGAYSISYATQFCGIDGPLVEYAGDPS